MHTFFFMILFGACASAGAAETDKLLHASASAALTIAGAEVFKETQHPLLYGASAALAAGIAKELWDAQHPASHQASKADLAADLLGIAIGSALSYSLRLQAAPSGGATLEVYGTF